MLRMTGWLVMVLVTTSMAPSSCQNQNAAQAKPAQIALGRTASQTITSKDQPCAGSISPCRTFQVSPGKAGILRAMLSWPKKKDASGLRLELWNGDDADGVCCHAGESADVSVAQAGSVVIRVILAQPHGPHVRQSFELRTSIMSSADQQHALTSNTR